MNYGEVIKQLREERHLTQSDLAKGICSRTNLAMFETKDIKISADILFKFLSRLNVSTDEFMYRLKEDSREYKREYFGVLDRCIKFDDDKTLVKLQSVLKQEYLSSKDEYYLLLLLKSVSFQTICKQKQVDIKSFILDGIRYLKSISYFQHFEICVYSSLLQLSDSPELLDMLSFVFDDMCSFEFIDRFEDSLVEFYISLIDYSLRNDHRADINKFISAFSQFSNIYINSFGLLAVKIFRDYQNGDYASIEKILNLIVELKYDARYPVLVNMLKKYRCTSSK